MTGHSRSKLDWLLVLVALLALGFGALLATAPSVLPSDVLAGVMTVEESIDPERALVAIAVVVGLFALWRSYFSGATDVRDADLERSASAVDSAPGAGSAERTAPTGATETTATNTATPTIVGESTTERAEQTLESLQRGHRAERMRDAVVDDLRMTLRAVERANGRSSETAVERVRTGAWTDDRTAAVFLGGTEAGTLSFWQRLRAWLFPGRTFERRLERTLAALEQYAADAEREPTMRTDTVADTKTSTDVETNTSAETSTDVERNASAETNTSAEETNA